MLKKIKRIMNSSRNEEGFSFIELLIVIVIIATLSGIIGFAYTKWIDSSRRSATLASLNSIKKAVTTYHLENGSFPTSFNQIRGRLAGNAKLVDAWGSPYKMARVARNNQNFLRIFSVGKDKRANTRDDLEVLIRTEEASSSSSEGSSSGGGSDDEGTSDEE